MNTIYRNYLEQNGVKLKQIIMLDLDDDLNARYRNPMELSDYQRGQIKDGGKRYYILIDEIPKVKPVPNPYLSGEEIGFVVNKGAKRYYIQFALTVAEEDMRQQEVNSLNRIDDSFTKIVIVKEDVRPWTDERGVQYINIEDFLLGEINEL